jgi:hypothetical protein
MRYQQQERKATAQHHCANRQSSHSLTSIKCLLQISTAVCELPRQQDCRCIALIALPGRFSVMTYARTPTLETTRMVVCAAPAVAEPGNSARIEPDSKERISEICLESCAVLRQMNYAISKPEPEPAPNLRDLSQPAVHFVLMTCQQSG